MTAKTITWHEECLKNMECSRASYQRNVDLELAMIARLDKAIALSTLQIETAKAEGKTEFDGEKYLKKRKK